MTTPRHVDRRWIWYLAAPLLITGALFLAPLGALARASVSGELAHYARFFGDSYYVSSLAITLVTAAVVTTITMVVSYPLAFTYWQAGTRWRALLMVLLLSPFYANVVVKVFGWMVLLARGGPVNAALMQLGAVDQPIDFLNGYVSVVIVSVHRSMPFMVLLIAAALARIDADLLEAARVCGASSQRVFRTVVLPLTIPGVVAGGILVFSLSMAAFVVPLLVGGAVSGRFLPVLMYQQITIAQNWGFGAAIGMILLAAALVTIAAGNRAVRSAKLGRVMGEGFSG